MCSRPGDLSCGTPARTVLVLLALTLCIGCESQRQLGPVPPPITRQEALARYNAHVLSIAPFRAKVKYWKVKFRDKDGKTHNYDGNGLKVYYHPSRISDGHGQFYLQLDNLFLKRAMVIGSNEQQFWVYSKAEESGGWGKYIHRGKACAENLSVDPEMLLQLIGLRPIPTNVNQYPLYEVGAEENFIRYVKLSDDGLEVAWKITFDRRSDLPLRIAVYDKQGKIVQQSRLGDYHQLGDAMLPGDIVISSPNDDSYFHLKLHAFKPDNRDRTKYFTLPEDLPGIKDYRQIDLQCENE